MKEEKKTIIYQLMPRWFTNSNAQCVPNGTLKQNGSGKFNEIDEKRLRSIKSLGATHVWYTGIIEHATATNYSRQGITPCNPHVVKGLAGSPYAIRDYYDVCPDLAVNVKQRMAEFEALVARTHKAGLKVIIDFVPNHVAREYESDAKPAGVQDLGENDNPMMFFDPKNNFYYITGQEFAPHGVDLGHDKGAYREFPARATGNDCYSASPNRDDWYETIKLNYGVDPWNGSKHFDPIPPTWHKMLDILLFWAGKGIDGLRCDMAHMVPVEFWHWAIAQVKAQYPALIFIPASDLTRCWQTVEGMGDHMLNFLENHDEQRIASRQFCGEPWKALPALVVSATMSKCPFMVYAGQELGEPAADAEGYSGHDGRTTIFDYWSVPTLRRWHMEKPTAAERKLRAMYRHLLRLCNSEPSLAHGQFFDLMYVNQETLDTRHQYAYLRHCDGEMTLIVANFGDTPVDTLINIPQHALDCANMAAGNYTCEELMTGQTAQTTLDGDNQFKIQIAPHNAIMWRFNKM